MVAEILRLPTVKARTGLSRSTIYLHISEGIFPKPVSLGARAVGWPDYEIEALNAARVASKTVQEIRELVSDLEVARTAAMEDP